MRLLPHNLPIESPVASVSRLFQLPWVLTATTTSTRSQPPRHLPDLMVSTSGISISTTSGIPVTGISTSGVPATSACGVPVTATTQPSSAVLHLPRRPSDRTAVTSAVSCPDHRIFRLPSPEVAKMPLLLTRAASSISTIQVHPPDRLPLPEEARIPPLPSIAAS